MTSFKLLSLEVNIQLTCPNRMCHTHFSSFTHKQETFNLLFNQVRKINFVNFVFPPTNEKYGYIKLIDNFPRCLIKHNIITNITQLTYSQQVMFELIYYQNIINRRKRRVTNISQTNYLFSLVTSKT